VILFTITEQLGVAAVHITCFWEVFGLKPRQDIITQSFHLKLH